MSPHAKPHANLDLHIERPDCQTQQSLAFAHSYNSRIAVPVVKVAVETAVVEVHYYWRFLLCCVCALVQLQMYHAVELDVLSITLAGIFFARHILWIIWRGSFVCSRWCTMTFPFIFWVARWYRIWRLLRRGLFLLKTDMHNDFSFKKQSCTMTFLFKSRHARWSPFAPNHARWLFLLFVEAHDDLK